MKKSQKEDACASTEPVFHTEADLPELERELEKLKKQQQETEAEAKRLLLSEDPAAGIFYAAEIHAKRQENMQLKVEVVMCENEIKRIKLGLQDTPSPDGPLTESGSSGGFSNGFPF